VKREAAVEEEGAGVGVGETEAFPNRPMMSSTAEREGGGGAEEEEEEPLVGEGPDPKMSARRSLVD